MTAKLHELFYPKTIAIIGASATPGKLGNVLASQAVKGGFPIQHITAVNPNSIESIAGLRTVRTVEELGFVPDLAVITTPSTAVPRIAQGCATLGVKNLIVITAGFGEVHTPEGDRLQAELAEAVRGTSTRVVGPNCFGIMNMENGLDLTFGSTGVFPPGKVSILSQSGGIAAALVDRARSFGVGLSKVITMGNASDLSWREYLDYLSSDRSTKALLIYVEGIGKDAEGFLASLREISEHKLVVVFKPGRSEAAAKAAATHTGSLAGNDGVFDAALRRTQAIRVNTLNEMFYTAVVANQELPRSNRYTFITNGGGPGVIAADSAALSGLAPSTLRQETLENLNAILPANWSRGNPIDIIGDADKTRYNKSIRIVLDDPNVESVIIMYIPTAMSPPMEIAQGIIDAVQEKRRQGVRKPVFVVWAGGWSINESQLLLERAGIPVFQNPDTAADVLGHLVEYRKRHEALYQTPRAIPRISDETLAKIKTLLLGVRSDGRTLLAENEAKEVLRLAQIPTNVIRVARSSFEASSAAADLKYPVAVKVHTEIYPGVDPSLSHKSEFGVHLDLRNPFDVADAYKAIMRTVTKKVGADAFGGVTVQTMVRIKDAHEIFMGTTNDPDFGPVLIFGRGGTHVEYFGDTAMGINQLSSAQMLQVIEQTRIHKVLCGVRGSPSTNVDAIIDVGVRLSELATNLSSIISSIDINPLLAGPDGLCALDARIELFREGVTGRNPAIRPYPREWVYVRNLPNNEEVTVRPIDATDEGKMQYFHQMVSQEDVYHRYYSSLPLSTRTSHSRLAPRCNIDYRTNMAFVAENAKGEIVSITRVVRATDDGSFEVAFFTRTDYKGRRIASILMNMAVLWAESEHIPSLIGMTEIENHRMRKVFERAGFTTSRDPEDATMLLFERKSKL